MHYYFYNLTQGFNIMNNIIRYKLLILPILIILLTIFTHSCKLFNSEEEVDNNEITENVLLPLQKEIGRASCRERV